MTVRIALSLASLWLVFVLPVKAQFWEATPAILFDDVEDLLVLPNGDVLAIVDGDGIYRSTDSGTSFIKVFDVSFVFEFGLGTNRIFAVGLRGTFISDDNGLTWNQLLPSDAWTVTAIGSDIAVGGTASILFNSTDNGATWTIPNVDQIPYLESTAVLAVVRMGDLIGYKTIFSDLMVSTNGGTTWSTVDVIDPDRLHYIDGLFYADRFDEVWTSVDLQNWNQLGTDSDVFWDDIAVNNDAIAVAGDFSGLAVSTDDGATWSDVSTELGTDRTMSVAFLPDGKLLVGTDFGVYRSVSPVTAAGGIAVESTDDIRSKSVLMDVFPNPTLGEIRITIKLDESKTYSVRLFDITGRKVTDLAKDQLGVGIQKLGWTKSLAPGVYFIVLESGDQKVTRKVTVLDPR